MVNKWVSRYSLWTKRMGLWKHGSLWLNRWRGVWVFGPGLLKWLVAIFVGDPSLRYWHILTPIPTPDLMTWVTCGVCDPRAAPPGVEAMRRTADLKAWTAATKSAGPWEKALAMSMAMAPGVETWTWRRWKTLKDVGKAAKPWKRLEKIESTATGARVSADMEKGAVLRIELLVHHLIFALAQCPCKVFVKRSFRLSHGCPMVVPWLHRSSRVQEPDAAYSVVLLSALGNWKVLLAKLQVGWGLFCHQGIRMKACQFSQWNG